MGLTLRKLCSGQTLRRFVEFVPPGLLGRRNDRAIGRPANDHAALAPGQDRAVSRPTDHHAPLAPWQDRAVRWPTNHHAPLAPWKDRAVERATHDHAPLASWKDRTVEGPTDHHPAVGLCCSWRTEDLRADGDHRDKTEQL